MGSVNSKMYKTLKQVNWPELELEILDYWDKQGIFQKSVSEREGADAFVFYEGPPSANGMPGIHHVMARAIKDIFCRFKTQQGFQVLRKAGWDTHGLPVELQVEKRLGIRKEDIGEKISVADYNAECKKDVMQYTDVWDNLTHRIGYWVDMENPYVTYENNYIETLWYILKQFHNKGLLYKGHTIQPYSPAAGTGLSSHELNQPGTYKMLRDTTAVAQFAAKDLSSLSLELPNLPSYFMAWTTTPWTLPSNTGLAVGPNIDYEFIHTFNPYTAIEQVVVLAKDRVAAYFSEEGKTADWNFAANDKVLPWKSIATVKGSQLQDLRYEQLLPYAQPNDGDAYKVVCADFVTTEDGTGIVHLAPSFGADDFKTAKEHGLGSLTLVDKKGRFVSEVTDFADEFVKEQFLTDEEKEQGRLAQGRDKYLSVDERIAIKLKQENKAFKVERYEHSYPHCWRTDKPILYYPLESWFINTTAAKDRLVELNKTINWKPKSTGEGRFGNWLENLVDWNLSRSRYWGTPLPIWRTEDQSEEICIGSMEELVTEIEKANSALGLNQSIDTTTFDLHRPFVDEVTLVSASGKPMTRETDLIDVWFDSGAMPYAQQHWPFENLDAFKKSFPADFIAEGVDQTRGWFFTLHVIATLLFDSVAFKNVVANGLVLDKNGNKMSKRLGNAVDPFVEIPKYGADAIRWYLITNSPPWDNLKFDIEGVDEARRKYFGTLYNTYSFFAMYAEIDAFIYDNKNLVVNANRSESDQWIISKLNSLIKVVTEAFNDYDPTTAGRAIEEFVTENLSNWYVRLNRKRFWRGEMNEDKKAAYETLYECLLTVSQLMAPISPFFCDWMYLQLTQPQKESGDASAKESVHLTLLPKANVTLIDAELEQSMELAQRLTSLVLSLRKKEKIKVRQPLQKIMVPVLNEAFGQRLAKIKDLVLAEVNVKEIQVLEANNNLIVKKAKPNFKTLGPKLGGDMKSLTQVVNNFNQNDIATLEQQGKIELNLGSRQFELELQDVEISSQDMPGWLVASELGVTVALDVNITDELKAEGVAREFVNRVQNLRKESGFNVTDRIEVRFQCDEIIKQNIEAHAAYICSEILAKELTFTEIENATEIDVYESLVKVQLQNLS